MGAQHLANAINTVNWNANIDSFLAEADLSQAIENGNIRLAIWAKQFETIDKDNPALCFIREMQVVGYEVATLAALGLYRASGASIRAMFETALYFTYFRNHPAELATLVRNKAFFVDKESLLEFHKKHTKDFITRQERLGVLSRLDKWYGHVSGIVHGQIPGTWVEHSALADVKFSKATLKLLVDCFVEGEALVHGLFLCTTGNELWHSVSTSAKRVLTKGLSGDVKAALALDVS